MILGGTISGPQYELFLKLPTLSLVIPDAPSEFRIQLGDHVSKTVSVDRYLSMMAVKTEMNECGETARSADKCGIACYDPCPLLHPNNLPLAVNLTHVCKAFIVFENPPAQDRNFDVTQTCLLME